MEALQWFGDVMQAILKIIPRILIVRSTHSGVKFVRGEKIVPLKPGIHIYWPVVTEVEIIPVARQTYNLSNQSLLTKDLKEVSVSPVIIYSINDIVRALARSWDVNDTINDITQLVVVEVVTTHDIKEILDGLQIDGVIEAKLTQITRKRLKRYGVRVHKCALSDFTTSKVVKLINDTYSKATQFTQPQS